MLRLIALLALASLPAFAQSATAIQLRQLNAEVLGPAANNRPGMERRAALLRRLAVDNPDEALREALPSNAAALLAGRFPGAPVETRGSMSGILEVEVEDGPENAPYTREIHGLRVGQQRYELSRSSRALDARAGNVRFEGLMLEDNQLVAESLEQVSSDLGCSTTGDQKIAVIRVRPPTSAANPVLASAIRDRFFGSTRSLSEFWREMSYGATWASGDVYPSGESAFYELDREYACSESSALYAKAFQLANADVNFQNYSRAMIIFPRPSTGCTFAGRASIGCWASSPDGGSISYALLVQESLGSANSTIQLVSHEGGHNLGLYHGSSISFPNNEPLGAMGSQGTRNEYGDRYSTIGFWNLGHYAAQHKQALGWLAPRTVTTTGTYTLEPIAAKSGDRSLLVTRGTQKLWIQYDRPIGAYRSGVTSDESNGALIRLGNSSNSSNSLLVNMNTSVTNAVLPSGRRWDDPYSDLSLDIGAATVDGLVVNVGYGVSPACVPLAPLVSVAPVSVGVEFPATATYALSVTNRDSPVCAPATYSLAASAGDVGVSIAIPSTATITPGGTQSIAVVVTPLKEDAATYGIGFLVGRPDEQTTATATLTVIPPARCAPAQPTVSMAPSSWTAVYPAVSTFTLTARNNDSTLCSAATFNFSAATSSGGVAASTSVANLTITPGAEATATITATPSVEPDASAIYNVTGTLARAGQAAVTAAASLTLEPLPCVVTPPILSLVPPTATTTYPAGNRYTLTIANRDSKNCAASSFTVSATAVPIVPGTGTVNVVVGAVVGSIAPGASGTVTITATPDQEPVAQSTYQLTATVSRPDAVATVGTVLAVAPGGTPGILALDVVRSGANGTVRINELALECRRPCRVESRTWPLTLTSYPSGNNSVASFAGCNKLGANLCSVEGPGTVRVAFSRR